MGGRGWRVVHLDWAKKVAHVEPAEEPGRSRWVGSSVPLSRTLCGAMKRLLMSSDENTRWSRRARERMGELRVDLAGVAREGTTVLEKDGRREWWTFAGLAVNQTLASILKACVTEEPQADNLYVRLPGEASLAVLDEELGRLRSAVELPFAEVGEGAADLFKFADLLPPDLLNSLVLARLADPQGAEDVLDQAIMVSGR